LQGKPTTMTRARLRLMARRCKEIMVFEPPEPCEGRAIRVRPRDCGIDVVRCGIRDVAGERFVRKCRFCAATRGAWSDQFAGTRESHFMLGSWLRRRISRAARGRRFGLWSPRVRAAQSWTEAAQGFKTRIDQPGWQKALDGVRAPLGKTLPSGCA